MLFEDAPLVPTFELELIARRAGHWPVAGADEAGRGPLAGPVVAAAVILDPERIPVPHPATATLAYTGSEPVDDDAFLGVLCDRPTSPGNLGSIIRSADAFTAVTSSDNTNIVGARIAKEDYHVPRVVAHIYDPARADIFRDLGIPTVASVRWTATRIHQMLLHRHVEPEVVFGNGETLLITETLPGWFGERPLRALDVDGEIHVVAVTRGGHSFLPARGSLAEPGDEVTFAVAATALGRLRSFLDKELGT